MTDSDKVVLYNAAKSSPSWRVRIALALKGIKYDYEPMCRHDLYTDEYKKVNTQKQIPTLVIDGHTLTQSLPIIEYLDEKYPNPPLLPKDAIDKAKVRRIAELINSGIQPLQNFPVLEKVGETKMEFVSHFVSRGLKALEEILQECSGKYCYGDSVTMADVCLVPQVSSSSRYNVDTSQYPTISRINKALVSIPEFQAADARRQPDTPEDERIN